MKILVLGASGMAGSAICLSFLEKGHEVTAVCRRKVAYGNCVRGDLCDPRFVEGLLAEERYDAVVNAAGVLNADADADKARAVSVNSLLPHLLSERLAGSAARLGHISTDCVFSGRSGQYKEDDPVDGGSFYDRSKALGELVNDRDLTFRTSIVGPDTQPGGIGLFNWFMKQSGRIYGYTEALWTGGSTLTLADAIDCALQEGLTGLYHLVNGQVISKYGLLRLFNRHFKDDAIEIVPDDRHRVNKSLLNTRSDFRFSVPSYEEMVIGMKKWVEGHRAAYAHYGVN